MNCEFCGEEFVQNTRAKDHRFCSKKCARKAQYNKGKDMICICKYCGKEFRPKERDRITYCSRECAFADKRVKPKEKVISTYKCIVCNNEFTGRKDTKYCNECRQERDRLKAYNRTTARTRVCKWCSKEYIPIYKASTYLYCSDECKRQSLKTINKNNPSKKLHKGGVSKAKRLRIWTRDNNTCQICGKKMAMDKINTISSGKPHPLAPTIDHIIPISIAKQMGWTTLNINKESNLQAAHFKCNILKGNKVVGEQLRIC
jgi:hypothetical protein